MTVMGRVAPPDRSTLSRRVRGVLSPYRERGNAALARRMGRDSRLRGNDGSPVGSRFRGNDEAPGDMGRRGAMRLRPQYPLPAAFAASFPLVGRGGIRRWRASGFRPTPE